MLPIGFSYLSGSPPLAHLARGVHINVHTLTSTFNNLYKKCPCSSQFRGTFVLKETIPFEELNI